MVVEGFPYKVWEKKGFYQLGVHPEVSAYSFVKWNPEKVHVVAIDGQHRLSALKRLAKLPHPKVDMSTWTIPATILLIHKVNQNNVVEGLLDVVRTTFIYINSKAEEVTEARKILLNDESLNDICAQEVIDN